MRPSRRTFLLLLAALGLAGCAASTSIVNQWQSPDPGPALTRILVVGMLRDASIRRTFEEEMVAALRAHGVDAQPGYRFLPDDGDVPRAQLEQAVRAAGATGVLSARVLQVTQQTSVVPTAPAYWGPPWGFYGWYGAAWGPVYAYPVGAFPAQVVTTQTVYGEVRLFSALEDRLVWAATTATFAPNNPRKDSAQFAQLIVEQLARRGLL
ncbi:MAG: hypothetical protein ACK5TK_16540 [Betaproteobacteria bacterium]